jgi:hypothetical protein
MYTILNNLAPNYLRDHFEMSAIESFYRLRNRKLCLVLPKPQTEYLKKSFELSLFRCNVIWRGCDSRSWRYSIDFCQRLCQLVELTVKVISLVLILAVINHINPNYGR